MEKLGGLVLAMSQASAFITQKDVNVAKYLKLYEKQRAKLLHDNSRLIGSKHESVAITFNETLEHLEEEEDRTNSTRIVRHVIHACAHLSLQPIPSPLLCRWLALTINQSDDSDMELLYLAAKSSLKKFSLLLRVNSQLDTVTVHVMVQEAFRIQMNVATRRGVIDNLLRAVHGHLWAMPHESDRMALFAHALIVIEHCTVKGSANDEPLAPNNQALTCLLLDVSWMCQRASNAKGQLEMANRALELCAQEHAKRPSQEEAQCYVMLGSAAFLKGERESAREPLRKARALITGTARETLSADQLWIEPLCLSYLGLMAAVDGDRKEADSLFQNAFDLFSLVPMLKLDAWRLIGIYNVLHYQKSPYIRMVLGGKNSLFSNTAYVGHNTPAIPDAALPLHNFLQQTLSRTTVLPFAQRA